MPRPKQRTPELRDRVIRTAVDLLAADGVAAFTTRRVAERAATSVPAIYELFGDRAGLIREVYLEGFRQLHATFDAVALTTDVDRRGPTGSAAGNWPSTRSSGASPRTRLAPEYVSSSRA